jgi:uncharacterized protein (TIGR03086 family)
MDLLTAYSDAVRRNQDRIEAVKADQLSDPTSCTEWDVRTLIGHLVGGCQMFAAALGSPQADQGPPADLAAAYNTAGQAAVSAFSAPGAMQRLAALPIGEVPGDIALSLALTEAVVHGWDLATATGQVRLIDEQLAATLLAGAEASIGADLRQPDGVMPVFAPAVAVGADRPAGERLVGFLGRRP